MDWLSDLFGREQVVGNLISGLLASIVTWGIISLRQMLSHWRQCARFTGRYVVTSREAEVLSDEVLTVSWLGGRVLLVEAQGATEQWRSTITLDAQIPKVGRGFYEYLDRDLVGRHDIQLAANKRDIYVFSDNPSDSRPSLALIWRRL